MEFSIPSPSIPLNFLPPKHSLNVSAEEESTGNKNDIIITNDKGRLASGEIKRMIEEAEMYKEDDMKFKKKVKAMNALDDFVYKMKSALKDTYISYKISSQDKKKLKVANREAKDLLDHNQEAETCVFESCRKLLERNYEHIIEANFNNCSSDVESDYDDNW